jgi:hypothetical protein
MLLTRLCIQAKFTNTSLVDLMHKLLSLVEVNLVLSFCAVQSLVAVQAGRGCNSTAFSVYCL